MSHARRPLSSPASHEQVLAASHRMRARLAGLAMRHRRAHNDSTPDYAVLDVGAATVMPNASSAPRLSLPARRYCGTGGAPDAPDIWQGCGGRAVQ